MHPTTTKNEGGIYNSQATVNIFYINLDINTNLKNLIDTKPGHVFKKVKKNAGFLLKSQYKMISQVMSNQRLFHWYLLLLH
jgi:hypothetical protein